MNLGVIWPGWESVRLIGRGSFGTVYEIQRKIGGEVERAAVKVIMIPQSRSDVEELRVSGYDDRSVTAHFEGLKDKIEREYMTMARLKGAVNIVYCDDIRTVQHDEDIGWDIYLKMELLTPLLSVMSSPVDESQVIKLGKDICRALVMCEQANVVHRDIKPQNIFVAKDGTYKLGDFGVAKTIEGTGSASVRTGTFRFMAPEVYNGEHYGHKADLYSFGMVLYWLLNECRSPFLPLPPELPTERTESAAKQRRFNGEPLPAPAHGSEALKRIVLKACAFDPKDRYQSAEEMLRDLNTLAGECTDVQPTPVERNEESCPVKDDQTISMYSNPAIGKDSTIGLFEKPKASEPSKDAEEDKAVGAFDRKPEPKPKKKTWSVIVGGLAAVLVLAALAYFVPGWTPATCETPETHRLLGITRGVTVGHQWMDATYSVPKTCSVCGATQGEPLPLPFTYEMSSDGVTITGYHGESTVVEIPAEIDSRPVIGIGYRAFFNCDSLVSVSIPDSVITIGEAAFSECNSLVGVTIPSSVTSIDIGAFSNCANLISVKIPNSMTCIGIAVFSRCTNLTSIEIPDSITSIGTSAFSGCYSLSSITIPDSVTNIGGSAFYWSGLRQIYYCGTESQWICINIGSRNDPLYSANIHYNSK